MTTLDDKIATLPPFDHAIVDVLLEAIIFYEAFHDDKADADRVRAAQDALMGAVEWLMSETDIATLQRMVKKSA